MTVTEPALEPGVVDRYVELTRRARGVLRGRRVGGPRVLLVVGAVAMSLGLLLAVLGYLGASHTIYVFEQLPYLISGGILGGSLLVAGSIAYFGHWLARVHAANERAAGSLERMEELLAVLVERSRP